MEVHVPVLARLEGGPVRRFEEKIPEGRETRPRGRHGAGRSACAASEPGELPTDAGPAFSSPAPASSSRRLLVFCEKSRNKQHRCPFAPVAPDSGSVPVALRGGTPASALPSLQGRLLEFGLFGAK